MQRDPSTVGLGSPLHNPAICVLKIADGTHGSSRHGACLMLHIHARSGSSSSRPAAADLDGCSLQPAAACAAPTIACLSF